MNADLLLASGSLRDIRRSLDSGAVSSTELVTASLRSIENKNGELNAFRTVLTSDALALARRADDALIQRNPSLPLRGIPFAVKENTALSGQKITWGTEYGRPGLAQADHPMVGQLRASGGIPVGLTRTPELDLWPFTSSRQGGLTKNPLDPSKTPGGSSGGSAAAVASGMVPFATGSDGGGSLRTPAAACGIVGFKPQVGVFADVTPSGGWYGLSVPGVLTRNVADTQLLWHEVLGLPHTASSKEPPRIGVSHNMPGHRTENSYGRAVIEAAMRPLRAVSSAVVSVVPNYGNIMAHYVPRWLAGVRADAGAIDHRQSLEPRTKLVIGLGRIGKLALPYAMSSVSKDVARINSIFDEVEFLATPILGHEIGDAAEWQEMRGIRTLREVSRFTPYCEVWNALGNPAVAIPIGWVRGLPLSIQLVGPLGSSAQLLEIAAGIEFNVGSAR